MYLFTDFIEPAELTGYSREALVDLEVNQFKLSSWLPSKTIDDIEYRFKQGGEGLAEAATFRNYDTPSRFGSRPGAVDVSGSLPPISRQIKLGEYERIRLRKSGNDAIVNAIYDDAKRMTRSVAARMELARGEALVTGKVVLAEGGVVATVDYGRDAGHTVTAGTPWTTTATAPALTNMIAWADTYELTNGERPQSALTSRKVLRLLTRNTEIINRAKGSAAGVSGISLAELQAVLETEGLPMPTTYDAQISVNKVARRVIADDQFLYLPAAGQSADESDLGATLWGVTAESMEAEYGIEDGEEPGIVTGVYKQPNPLAYFTNSVGIGLPVLANPNLTFAADVA